VDNASTDDSLALTRDVVAKLGLGWVVEENARNIGFARGVDHCAAFASNELIMLFNPDAILTVECLDRLVSHLLASETIGAVGPTSLRVNGDQKVGYLLETQSVKDESPDSTARRLAALAHPPRPAKLLIGFALLMRRSFFEEVGGLQSCLFAGGDDLILCHQARALGYELLIARDTYVSHISQVSFSSRTETERFYLGAQGHNRVYEWLYSRIGRGAADGKALFDIGWYLPVTEKVSVVLSAACESQRTLEVLENLTDTARRDLEVVIVGECNDPKLESWAELNSSVEVQFVQVPAGTRRTDRLNEGISCSTGDYIVCLDSSVQLSPGWLANMLAATRLDSEVGVVGPRLASASDEQVASACTYSDLPGFYLFADDWFIEHAGKVALVGKLSSSCILMTRKSIEEVGGFDSAFWGQEGADRDLCLRIRRAGLKLVQVQDVFVHNEICPAEELLGDSLQRYDDRVFVAKHGHIARDRYEFTGLALSKPWDSTAGYISPSLVQRLGSGQQVDSVTAGPSRLLMIPDWHERSWYDIFRYLVSAGHEEENIEVMIRVEPADPETVDLAQSITQGLIDQVRNEGRKVCRVLLHETSLAPSERASIYASCSAFVPCGGRFAATYRLEAQSVGLPLLGETDVHDAKSAPPALVSAK
jgi:GT2 family glycosyltransferase